MPIRVHASNNVRPDPTRRLGGLLMLLLATLLLAGCNAQAPSGTGTVAPPSPQVTPTSVPSATPSPSPSATLQPTPTPTPSSTPSPLPTDTPLPTATPEIYVVGQGDIVEAIAAQFDVPLDELLAANGITKETLLSIGQELIIPRTPVPTEPAAEPTASAPAASSSATPLPTATIDQIVHVVESGEVLGRIAAQYDLDAETVAEANGIEVDSLLSVGQKLIIPVPTATGAPTSEEPVEATPTATEQPTATSRPTATLTATSRPTATVRPTATSAATVRPTSPGRPTATTRPTATATPPPTPTPGASPTPERLVHVVAQGEVLGRIAAQYGLTAAEVAEANDISVDSTLRVGQELVIILPAATSSGEAATPAASPSPAASATLAETAEPQPTATPAPTVTVIHVVERGDTLGGIAVQYDVSAEDIAKANDITLTTILKIGQELVIPGLEGPTPTPGEAQTETSTPTAQPSASPTRRPTSQFPYLQPRLLAPVNGATVKFKGGVLLNWTSVGILSDDEWYRLTVWRSPADADPVQVWTKATSWRPTDELSEAEEVPRWVRWQVVVVRRNATTERETMLSSASETYEFYLK